MSGYSRKDDKAIDEIQADVKKVLTLLLGNGKAGICEKVRDNEKRIDTLENKSGKVRNVLVAIAVILNTVVASVALYKGF